MLSNFLLFSGFGDGHGGLVIGLFPEEKMSTAEPSAEPQPNSKPEPEPKAKAAQGCALSTVLLTVIVCAVARSISGS